MNKNNKTYRFIVITVCGICFFVVTSISGIFVKNVEADKNQISDASGSVNLNLALVGTVLSDGGKSVAIFEDNQTNIQKFYKLGDEMEYGQITKILKDRVFLTQNNVEVELKIGFGTGNKHDYDAESGSSLNKEESFRNTIDRLTRMPELIPQPEQLDEDGFHVGGFSGNDLLGKLGLQTGDIIRDINGQVPGAGLSPKEAIAQVLKDGDELLQIEVERDGYREIIEHHIQQ